MLQLGFGLDPLHSGLITFAAAAGALFMKTIAARILRAFGFRAVLTVNAVVAAALLALNGAFTAGTPHALIIAVLLVGGCFRSLQFTAVNAIAYADVDPQDMSAATSLASVAQQLSLSIGVAFGAFALQSAAEWHGRTEIRAEDFWPAFLAVSILSGLSTVWFRRLAPEAGAEVSGHRIVQAKPAADAT